MNLLATAKASLQGGSKMSHREKVHLQQVHFFYPKFDTLPWTHCVGYIIFCQHSLQVYSQSLKSVSIPHFQTHTQKMTYNYHCQTAPLPIHTNLGAS